jgi:uncharacterized membrane protein
MRGMRGDRELLGSGGAQSGTDRAEPWKDAATAGRDTAPGTSDAEAGRRTAKAGTEAATLARDPEAATSAAEAGEGAAETETGAAAVRGADAGPPVRVARADRVPWLIALLVFAAYLPISLFRYWRLEPTSWDLGIFTEYVKQYANLHAPIVDIRAPGMDLLGDHFHPIVALIAPFFRLFPTPVTLLVAQALLAAVSVIPVSRAAADKLGVGAGRAIGAAYGFSWGLQQMINYDFHEIAFAVPLLAFSLSALVRGRYRAAILWALPLVLVKEDQGFTLAAIGIIIILVYRRPRDGLLLTFWGVAWSLLAITVIIPHFSPTHSYLYWYEGGGISPVGGHFSVGGLVSQLTADLPTKVPTLVMIALPTAFIALRSPLALAAVPSLLLRFIGANPYYWSTDWHYNATVMPIVFIAAIDAMARIRAAREAAAAETAGAHGAPAAREPGVAGLAARRMSAVGQSGVAGLAARGNSAAGQSGVAGLAARGNSAAGQPGVAGWAAREPGPLSRAMERYGAAMMLAIAAALAFQFPLSQLWTPQTYTISPHVRAAEAAMALVPNGATVATDLDLLAALADRTDTYWLGNSGAKPPNPPTEYVVFDSESTDYAPPFTPSVLGFVEGLNQHVPMRQIYANDGVYVFIRTGGQTRPPG